MPKQLGKLPDGWDWFQREGYYAAGLLTSEYDSWVFVVHDGAGMTVCLSQKLAPVEVVLAVIEANKP